MLISLSCCWEIVPNWEETLSLQIPCYLRERLQGLLDALAAFWWQNTCELCNLLPQQLQALQATSWLEFGFPCQLQALQATSCSEFGFSCQFHHREEYTEQHSGCYISLLWIEIMFFCFWETNLSLGYPQNPISETLNWRTMTGLGCCSLWPLGSCPSQLSWVMPILCTHPSNLHISWGSSGFYCHHFVWCVFTLLYNGNYYF